MRFTGLSGSACRWKLAMVMPAFALALSSCGGDDKPQAPPPPLVTAETLRPQVVQYVVELPGRVQAMRTAEVRARVNGIVQRRLYVEGTDIKAGTPMFQIDPKEMRAADDSAIGALNRAQSVLRNANQDVERYRPLVAREAISKQEYDAATARAAQAAADVASARAQADRARLDLNYATVTAPISGRAGRAQVTEGALVSASQATLLATVEQLDPIYVNFSQSSTELLKLRREFATGQLQQAGMGRVLVRLVLDDGSEYEAPGHLDFLDMAVDPSTGTVSLRAEFPNRSRLLLPGQFVRARVEAGTNRNGIAIPQRAVKMTTNGATVYVLGPKNLPTVRSVKLGAMQGDRWVVVDGLKAGERIVVDGVQKVQPGQPVRVADKPGAKPAAAASAKSAG